MVKKPKFSDCELRVLPKYQQLVISELSGNRPGRMARPYHLFVVHHQRDLILELFIASVFNHEDIVLRNSLEKQNIIGGGEVSVVENELYVGGSSSDFSCVPIACQHAIALSLMDILNSRGIAVSSVRSDTKESPVFWNKFWKSLNRSSLRKPH